MYYLPNFIPIFFPLLFALIPIINATNFTCNDFSQKRIDELEKVARKGHPKTPAMLNAEEYEALIGGCKQFKQETIEIFNDNMHRLRRRMNDFSDNFKQIKEINSDEIDHIILNGGIEKHGKLAIGCKKLLMEILSENGEGSRINIFSFIKTDKSNEFEWLGKCEQISKLQSRKLDQIINEDLWMEHMANAPNEAIQAGIKMHRVVVEGGGPIGLLTTFRLFMAGMDVTIVEGRDEYTRNQVIFFDANWHAQMAYLLGTKYNEIVGNQENAFGRVVMDGILISAKHVEKASKRRLEEFAKFLREKKTNRKPKIKLIYGFIIVDVEHSKSAKDPHFYAILNKKNSKKRIENHQRIPFDFFICAGGAGDRMRAKFGMEILNHSVSKKYGSSRLFKQKGENVFISEALFSPVFKMNEMKNWVLEAKFEKVMENIGTKLSQNIQNELKNLGENMAKSTEKQELRGAEPKDLISIGYIVPKEIVNILKIIEEEKGRIMELKDKVMMDKLVERILAKWTVALFGYYYEKLPGEVKPKLHLNINENGEAIYAQKQFSLNLDKSSCDIFDVQIRTAHKVAEKLENKFVKGNSVVAFVLGDALASPHFYNGNGASTGRMGMEFLVEKLKMFNLGEIHGIENLMNQVSIKLDLVKENVVEWASEYIEIENPKGKQNLFSRL